ncbi:MAG: hypothetical protein M9934_06115 [Thermomicrobiales bacterium]|nr:hypothetical protein [Thermomicrobiales bacterium]
MSLPEHRGLQRRIRWAAAIIFVLAVLLVVPLVVDDNLRLDLAQRTGLAPGRDAVKLADSSDGTLLIVIPLDNDDASGVSPWLYRAQFIAWPTDSGLRLENLESSDSVDLPLSEITFTAANGDGTLVLMRGPLADGSGDAAYTVTPESMTIIRLDSADAIPDAEGDWETPTWEKTKGTCNRPSPEKTLVGCFRRAGTASYLAGDWQLQLQLWGDYEQVTPVMRGMGFLPWVGFARNDTVVYMQNEVGLWRLDVPKSLLESRPSATPVAPRS